MLLMLPCTLDKSKKKKKASKQARQNFCSKYQLWGKIDFFVQKPEVALVFSL